MLKLARPRLFARSMPTTPVLTKAEVLARLTKQSIEAEAKDEEFSLDGLLESLSPAYQAAERRAAAFTIAQKKALSARLGYLKRDEKELIEAAIGKGQWRGVHSQHHMHEKIAALHEASPWMASAASAVMKHMNVATKEGAAPFTMPPLLLVGKPGIGKSQWARALAEAFAVPSIEVDIGGAGGGLFALSGVERGWGSATPGRLVREMLASHVVNPLVILDEVDKAPTSVTTSKGTGLPGTYEVLKSLIEPSTARSWVCPYYQLPFDMSRVNWAMTTNSIDQMPDAFLDRCKIIHLEDPTKEQMIKLARQKIAARFEPDEVEPITALIAKHLNQPRRHSLRSLNRMIDRLESRLQEPRLI